MFFFIIWKLIIIFFPYYKKIIRKILKDKTLSILNEAIKSGVKCDKVNENNTSLRKQTAISMNTNNHLLQTSWMLWMMAYFLTWILISFLISVKKRGENPIFKWKVLQHNFAKWRTFLSFQFLIYWHFLFYSIIFSNFFH